VFIKVDEEAVGGNQGSGDRCVDTAVHQDMDVTNRLKQLQIRNHGIHCNRIAKQAKAHVVARAIIGPGPIWARVTGPILARARVSHGPAQ
jgi:hypothetical protein